MRRFSTEPSNYFPVRRSLIKIFLLSGYLSNITRFKDAKVQDAISKHLIKTVCSEVTNDMVRFIAFEQLQQLQSESLSNEVKVQ